MPVEVRGQPTEVVGCNLGVGLAHVACGEDDNPIVDNDENGESFHADADGFVLKVDGQEIYRQFQGAQTGGITLKSGDELDVLAVFLDPTIGEFFPETAEEGEEQVNAGEDQ